MAGTVAMCCLEGKRFAVPQNGLGLVAVAATVDDGECAGGFARCRHHNEPDRKCQPLRQVANSLKRSATKRFLKKFIKKLRGLTQTSWVPFISHFARAAVALAKSTEN
jgi:hypothetical protein